MVTKAYWRVGQSAGGSLGDPRAVALGQVVPLPPHHGRGLAGDERAESPGFSGQFPCFSRSGISVFSSWAFPTLDSCPVSGRCHFLKATCAVGLRAQRLGLPLVLLPQDTAFPASPVL